jgi:hypothetical protein
MFYLKEAKDSATVGFIVMFTDFAQDSWNDIFYVSRENMFLSDKSVLFNNEYYYRKTLVHNASNHSFYYGQFCARTRVQSFDKVHIMEVCEVPEWVNKSQDALDKEIKNYYNEFRKTTSVYKICRFFGKK